MFCCMYMHNVFTYRYVVDYYGNKAVLIHQSFVFYLTSFSIVDEYKTHIAVTSTNLLFSLRIQG